MDNKITIGEVIALVDAVKPNTQSDREKISWLNNLDRIVKEDIIDTHEGYEEFDFNGYDENTPTNTALLIPAHYGRDIYRHYLELNIDLINKEFSKYNSSSALFQSCYNNFELYWHDRHIPLQPNSIKGV